MLRIHLDWRKKGGRLQKAWSEERGVDDAGTSRSRPSWWFTLTTQQHRNDHRNQSDVFQGLIQIRISKKKKCWRMQEKKGTSSNKSLNESAKNTCWMWVQEGWKLLKSIKVKKKTVKWKTVFDQMLQKTLLHPQITGHNKKKKNTNGLDHFPYNLPM